MQSILKQAFDLGARELGLYTTGEPFIYKDLVPTIKFAKDLGYEYVYITSNGSLATPEHSLAVIAAGLDSIKFSVNAATRETYLKVHGRDDFDKVLANIRFIKKYRDENHIPLKIGASFVINKFNEHEVDIAADFLSSLTDAFIFNIQSNQGGYMNDETLLPGISCPCPMVFNRCHITHEGYLTMCCVDYQNYLVVADLKEEPLDLAWSSPTAAELRGKHISRQLDGTLCHNCTTGKNYPIEPLVPRYATKFAEFN